MPDELQRQPSQRSRQAPQQKKGQLWWTEKAPELHTCRSLHSYRCQWRGILQCVTSPTCSRDGHPLHRLHVTNRERRPSVQPAQSVCQRAQGRTCTCIGKSLEYRQTKFSAWRASVLTNRSTTPAAQAQARLTVGQLATASSFHR
jgi:hypothetical protein